MYQKLDMAVPGLELRNGVAIEAIASLADGYGGFAHIWVDDGCYQLGIERTGPDEEGNRIYVEPVTHIFPEALEVLRSLPPLTDRNDVGHDLAMVTEHDILKRIASVDYSLLPGTTLTICSIRMVNGFTVIGESACLDPKRFSSEIGNLEAYKDAFRKLWAFEGYLLAEKRANNGEGITWTRDERERHIAAACHEINSAYCQALGDDSQPNWDAAPDWQKQSAINGVRLHMDNPNARPEASHESWMAEKAASGWVWGPIKDADAKTHPCMVPFSELPREQQAKDFIFRAVVHALA